MGLSMINFTHHHNTQSYLEHWGTYELGVENLKEVQIMVSYERELLMSRNSILVSRCR